MLSETNLGAGNDHMKVASIHIVRHCRDPRNRLLEEIRTLLFVTSSLDNCTVTTSLLTDLHQPLRLLDNPAGQSRHGEILGRRAKEYSFWHQQAWSQWQALVRKEGHEGGLQVVLGHDSSVCKRLKLCLGATVTTSGPGIGAAASASAAASVVFAPRICQIFKMSIFYISIEQILKNIYVCLGVRSIEHFDAQK